MIALIRWVATDYNFFDVKNHRFVPLLFFSFYVSSCRILKMEIDIEIEIEIIYLLWPAWC